ncbi:MAG: hypothetical protein ACLFSY_03190 [Desulfonatronovibrionaceae bacterium]
MGRVLQIRVMAYTYDQNEVRKRWPGLSWLAFGKKDETREQKQGVLELVHVLEDKYRFAEDIDEEIKKEMSSPVEELKSGLLKLDTFLADRRPREADQVTYALEDTLDSLEGRISPLL